MAIRSYFRCAAYMLVWLACGGACLAADAPKFKPGRVIPLLEPAGPNLVPNASFECGTDGWGSTEMDLLPGWYGTLNRLFGQLDSTTAADGHASLKIELDARESYRSRITTICTRSAFRSRPRWRPASAGSSSSRANRTRSRSP